MATVLQRKNILKNAIIETIKSRLQNLKDVIVNITSTRKLPGDITEISCSIINSAGTGRSYDIYFYIYNNGSMDYTVEEYPPSRNYNNKNSMVNKIKRIMNALGGKSRNKINLYH